ncbi:uncharacterized protein C8A04DRAFT_16220 [Dichotomopilus funicola]|uniref:F-box domain-containing protein n=1 Tax=Dichotomopilus funicola TaxID=1934379 RepID=A0AAN6UU96_9PEZI|nr:hypothetical protein C8A04DRAFT_16220 [Dichotomopilus funicola]
MTAKTPARWEGLTCTQRRIKDFTLDDNLSNLETTPRPSRRHEPVASAGALEFLPIEILHEVFHQLDLRSLTYLRLVNRHTIELVNGLPQFSDVIRHAFNALRGILVIGTGSCIS